jgi:hypothetical protein
MKRDRARKVLRSGPLETLFSGNATAKIMDFMIRDMNSTGSRLPK